MTRQVPSRDGLRPSRNLSALLSLLLALSLFAASCGGEDETEDTSAGADTTEAASDEAASDEADSDEDVEIGGADPGGSGERHICMIGGGDAFFAVVKNGADAAGAAVEAAGSKYTWLTLATYENIGPDMVVLIEQAVSQGCTALALPNWNPDAENPAMNAAREQGVEIFLINAGIEEVDNVGANGYYGSDEFTAGTAGGKYFGDNGATHVLCVNTSPGSVNIQKRCDGVAEGIGESGGKMTMLELPGESFGAASAISNAVSAKLTEDSSIDGVITIASGDADAAAAAIADAGADVQLGTFDLSENVLNRIESGDGLFAIDQQGWLQGWLGVSNAWYYDQYGILPATRTILTGPALVTADNIDSVKAGVETGQR